MDPISEGSLEGTSTSTRTSSTQEVEAQEQLEQLELASSRLSPKSVEIRNNQLVEVRTRPAPPPPIASAMSERTLQLMEQLEKMKIENEMLKASKVNDPAGMSDRSRQIMDQLEQVKRENDALKASSVVKGATQRRRLAYLEQNHASASKARKNEIRKMILTSQELDLAFLVDSTGSMHNCIKMIKDTVANMAADVQKKYPECKMRVAFAPYRDYEDTVEDDDGTCDFTTSFTGPDSDFTKALSRVRASGGGDSAEDVFTGIAKVAGFNWQASNRLLIHIADAPCHGIQFHNGVGDNYPDGDKYGRKIENQLQLLKHCKVSAYYFCHLNTSTTKMLEEFKKAAGGKLTIKEEKFDNITAIPDKVVTLCRSSIQNSLGSVGKAHPHGDMKFLNEVVVAAVPSWSNIPTESCSHFKHKRYLVLDDLLSKIDRKLAIDEEVVENVQIEIATNPFTSEGAVRWPYHAKITHPSPAPRFMVVKRFKTPLNTDVRKVHNKDQYLAQMEVQSVAAQMAEEFNSRTRILKNVKRVEFTQVTTLEVGSGPARKFYNMEERLEGKWIRYSNNVNYVNIEDYAAVLQAFTHWTYERSRCLLMVNDLQGVCMEDKNGKSMFRLCDPAIHCTDVLRFTRTNLGEQGFKLFFDTHKCNDVCKHLGLAVGKAGYTSAGTLVTW